MKINEEMQLKYNEDGVFRIVQFTDTHIGNMPFHEDDYKTFDLINNVLSKVEVDLIVHTGDIIWSDGVKDAHIVFQKTLEKFEAHKRPMAVTFGNHDAEEIITREDLRNIFAETVTNRALKKHSYILDNRESYVVEIHGSADEEVKHALYFMDTGADAPLPIGTYDWNQPEQIEWFRKTAAQYKKGDGVKRNIIFQHIPVPEYWESRLNILDGVHYETDEEISSPHINTGLFANMILNDETWGMFVGHDHENNFDSLLHGIHLVYGNVSGYQTYGSLGRGVRIIELNEKEQSISTYLVDYNGNKMDDNL